jgi:hypothetical protein
MHSVRAAVQRLANMNEHNGRCLQTCELSCGRAVVGIVSRADLLHALARVCPHPAGNLPNGCGRLPARSLGARRRSVGAEESRQCRSPRRYRGATGSILGERERQALHVLAETTPGVKVVKGHLVPVEPMSGLTFEPPGRTVSPA